MKGRVDETVSGHGGTVMYIYHAVCREGKNTEGQVEANLLYIQYLK